MKKYDNPNQLTVLDVLRSVTCAVIILVIIVML